MARLYSHRRGSSGSKRPISKKAPPWLRMTADEVKVLVTKLAKEGKTKSEIGTILRDQHGIPLVEAVTGKSIGQMLREEKIEASRTEDLDNLIEKARLLREHLARQTADRLARHSLQLVESKIRRLGKYYVRNGVLPRDWRYAPR
ncbi:MAG: 30S ribosomal protein S15 [Candidatus Brockarchaeota archaeon]|nr:30S ribosomal protein S15 [Candidatus Brockarchaeota archaeon]